jgi:hypothetical protein
VPVGFTVLDGASAFSTADGRKVLLAGLHIPDTDTKARALLTRLLSAGPLSLAPYDPDRYGRIPAEVFSGGLWVQSALLREGAALAAPDLVSRSCAAALLAIEDGARKARKGLWASPRAVLDVEALQREARARAGTFVIVEGTATKGALIGGRAYLNFGPDYRTDFTVTVAPPDMRLFRAAKIDLRKWDGRRVRVRGWLELYNGPELSLTVPEALEVLDTPKANGPAQGPGRSPRDSAKP